MRSHTVKKLFHKPFWNLGGTLDEVSPASEMPEENKAECVNWKVHRDGKTMIKRPGYGKNSNVFDPPDPTDPSDTTPPNPPVQIHQYKDVNNLERNLIVTTKEIISSKEVIGYERKWLSSHSILPYMYEGITIYEGNLVFSNYEGGDFKVTKTEDGETFTDLFKTTQALGNLDAIHMAEFDGSLWISSLDNEVVEWNGSSVVNHNPSGDTAKHFYVWGGRLWLTVFIPNTHAKIYNWNGVSWTGISNYGGSSYIDFNCSSGEQPRFHFLHRAVRLYSFGDKLYLMTPRWDTTNGQWKWKLWQFDSAKGDRFNEVFDSQSLDAEEILITSNNNKADFDEGGSELTATVAEGLYSKSGLETALKSALDSAGSSTYTVSIDPSTHKTTVSTSGATLNLKTDSGSNFYKSIWRDLGFDMTADQTGSTSYTSVNGLDGFIPGGMIEYKGKYYIFAMKIETTEGDIAGSTGTPRKMIRIYSSEDGENWSIEKTQDVVGGIADLIIYNERIYLASVKVRDSDQHCIWYWDRIQKCLVQEQELTTNTDLRPGGFAILNGRLYYGKKQEVYKRVIESNEWSDIYYESEEPENPEPPAKVNLEGRLAVGGFKSNLLVEGETVHSLGIKPPKDTPSVSIGAAGNLSGDYKYVVTFRRSGNWPCESNPSPESATVSPSSDKVILTDIPTSTDPKVNQRRIYRTKANGAILYWVGDIDDNATTTFTDNYYDSELGSEVSYDRHPPPKGKYFEVWDNRLWIAGNSEFPSMLYFTNTGTSEEWNDDNFIAIKRRESDRIMQIKAFGDYLFVWKQKSWFRIEKAGSSLYRKTQMPQSFGCDASPSVAVCGQYLIWKSEYGIEIYNGSRCLRPRVSEIVQKTFESINRNYLHKCIGGHNENEHEYWLTICTGTNTEPDKVIVFDYIQKSFTIYQFAKGCNCFVDLTGLNDQLIKLIGTPDGNILIYGEGHTDDGKIINANFKTGWIQATEERGIWTILRQLLTKYKIPEKQSYTGLIIGAGDGSKTSFSYTCKNLEVNKNSVAIKYTISSTDYTATDDGDGNISGTNCSGTIDYDTGAISLTFSTAPDNGTNVTLDYETKLYITMKIYRNFRKAPFFTKKLYGSTPTTDDDLRKEILRIGRAGVRGYHFMFEFVNNQDPGGETRVIGMDIYGKQRVWKRSSMGD